jgi:hypothetical protein
VAGQENVCLVRCQNGARAGPFGGVVPVQMADPAAAGGNATAGGNGTANAGADADAAAKARRSLAKRLRVNGMKLEKLKRRAVALAQDAGDPDVLAELLEDCE